MSLGDQFNLDDNNGTVRIAGTLNDPGATSGDVLTVQSDGSIAAAAGGGGGGSGNAVVRGPFGFAFDTAGLAAGVAFYTPTIGDVLLDAWIEVDTAFDGTTPLADFGSFNGTTSGMYSNFWGGVVDLTSADHEVSPGVLSGNGGAHYGVNGNTPLALTSVIWNGASTSYDRLLPAPFTAADPLLLVVSQDGSKGGTEIDSTQGAGRIYIVTAAPTAF